MKVTQARPEVLIKFNQLPVAFTEEPGGARTFELGGDSGPTFVVTLSKKSSKRLGKAAEEWPEWMAVVTGRFGELLAPNRYRIDNPALNVIERKAKESAAEPMTQSEQAQTAQTVSAPAPVSIPESMPVLASVPPLEAVPVESVAVLVARAAAVLEALVARMPAVPAAPTVQDDQAAHAAPPVPAAPATPGAPKKNGTPHPFVAKLTTPPPAPRAPGAEGRGRFRSSPIVTYRGTP